MRIGHPDCELTGCVAGPIGALASMPLTAAYTHPATAPPFSSTPLTPYPLAMSLGPDLKKQWPEK
eukprot:354321-Chlamydomonas_euryale.AAC.3